LVIIPIHEVSVLEPAVVQLFGGVVHEGVVILLVVILVLMVANGADISPLGSFIFVTAAGLLLLL
jgi:hypothetical protein